MTIAEFIEKLQELPQDKEAVNSYGEEVILDEKQTYVEIS